MVVPKLDQGLRRKFERRRIRRGVCTSWVRGTSLCMVEAEDCVIQRVGLTVSTYTESPTLTVSSIVCSICYDRFSVLEPRSSNLAVMTEVAGRDVVVLSVVGDKVSQFDVVTTHE